MSDDERTQREGEEPVEEPVAEVDPNAGKTVIVAGSPEHEALLKSNPNATSYGPDVVIVPAPEPEEPQEGQGAPQPISGPETMPGEEEEEVVQRDDESDDEFELRRQAWEQQRRGR